MRTVDRLAAGGRSRLATFAGLAGMVVTALTVASTPAVAASGIGVYVGYADDFRAQATNFPTPWDGSPNTVFEGCRPAGACTFDGGSVRVVNNTTSTVTVDAITVHIDSCKYTGWPSAQLAPGADLIVAQLGSGAASGCTGPTPTTMDTSDIGRAGAPYALVCGSNDNVLPVVDVTVDGQMTSYTDTGQVLNTGGIDGACPPPGLTTPGNESTQWTVIGHTPCNGSLFSLTPPSQTRGVGTTATVTATFTNTCNQPLSNVLVNFSAQPNALSGNLSQSGSAVTDSSGQATFSYSQAHQGTDTVSASITNTIGTLTATPVTVNWVLFAPGGGGFVIGNLNLNDSSVNFWGAQWWKNNQLSGGLAPASFKGFENSKQSPWCGDTWTSRPGNSSRPPKSVPSTMAVIVSSHITKRGPVISGDIVAIVMVKTEPGYGPNPGHRGNGTIVGAPVCTSVASIQPGSAGSTPALHKGAGRHGSGSPTVPTAGPAPKHVNIPLPQATPAAPASTASPSHGHGKKPKH